MKKKDLYKLVKQSLKEVVQEQFDKSGGQGEIPMRKEPQSDPVDPFTGLVGTGTGTDTPLLNPNDDFLQAEPFDPYAFFGSGYTGMGTPTVPTNLLDVWVIDSNGDCQWCQIGDGWIQNSPNDVSGQVNIYGIVE